MRRFCSFVFLLIPFIIFCQDEHISNCSLEEWKNGMPINWRIEQNTVDIFKANQKIIPYGVKTDDTRFRAIFPEIGSHGLSYIGLAGNEIISGAMTKSLEKNKFYKLSFYVYNPPLYTDRITKKFTVQFEYKKGFSSVLLLETDRSIDTTSRKWFKVSKIIRGSNKEKRIHIGFLGNNYKDHPHNNNGLYYLFDEISIKELIPMSDTLDIFFDSGSNEFTRQEELKLKTIDNKNYFKPKFILEGHASVLGDSKANYELSLKRAQAVKEYLIENNEVFIDSLRSLGENQSKIGNEKEDRRVRIIIDYLGGVIKPESKIAKSNYDLDLINVVDKMIVKDQLIRMRYDSIHTATNGDTIVLKSLLEEMRLIDSVNINVLSNIFDTKGYPGITKVGPALMDAGFLLLHHADLEVRLKYASIIKEAISNGEATKTWLPYFEDRNLLDQDKKQIYGTQLYWDDELKKYNFFEIENLKEADRLRSQLRMGTLKKYLKFVSAN